MHCTFEGIFKLELAAFLYMAIRALAWFSLEAFNAQVENYPWPPGMRPPEVFKTSIEGNKDKTPHANCHVHWTASQVRHFALHSEAVLLPLLEKSETFKQQVKEWDTTQKKQLHLGEPLESDGAAAPWFSFLAHVAVIGQCLRYHYTLADVHVLDELIMTHSEIFNSVKAYDGLYKPKHHFVTHYPDDIITYGPLRHWWCFRFEAMNQVIKRIAEGSSYQNLLKRIALFWCLKSARDLTSGKVSNWGLTRVEKGSRAELKFRGGDLPAVDLILEGYYPDCDELVVSTIDTLFHMGDSYSPGKSWVLAQCWGDNSPRGLANIAAMYETNGEIFLIIKIYESGCADSDALIAGTTSATGLQLNLSAKQLVTPDIQLVALRDVGFTPLHHVLRGDGSATFTLAL
jgi:hypothetical protein